MFILVISISDYEDHAHLAYFLKHRERIQSIQDPIAQSRYLPWYKNYSSVSHDVNNATYNYKQTYHVELPTVCKNDLICLSKKQAGKGHVIIECDAERMSNYDTK